ncbi:MAG: hypothetical protein EPO68_02235 [Planctomycetota bacterium]|nr:MAG: hypothetical protein EPO68_02235 [Planctomycetota bacterium]
MIDALTPLFVAALALRGVPLPPPVLTVDDTPGAAMFTTIQAAVDVAPAGATIRVASGAYAGFALEGKDLAVIADAGASATVFGVVYVSNVAADSEVLLRGLTIVGLGDPGAWLFACNGSVWIEDCTLQGTSTSPQHAPGEPGLLVKSCADVRVSRCVLQASDGTSEVVGFVPSAGGNALDATDSTVRLFDSLAMAGGGGQSTSALEGGDGGDAVRLVRSRVTVWGSQLHGGNGGASLGQFVGGAWICGVSGDGGHAFRAIEPPAPPSIHALGLGLVPGSAGAKAPGPLCAGGMPGVMLYGLFESDVLHHTGPYRPFFTESPAEDGAAARIHLQGQPGDLALVALGVPVVPFPLAGMIGSLYLLPSASVLKAGVWSAAAFDPLLVPLPQQAAGFESLRAYLQGAVVTSAGEVRLLAPATLLAIDDAI